MEISKKDLLKETGISYGQLYRWKREGLIPEEWFEKRSSFTGQETFFPKEAILKRIEMIQQLKDHYSLEEMAKMLTPNVSNRVFNEDDLEMFKEITTEVASNFMDVMEKDEFTFSEVIMMVAFSKCVETCSMQEQELHTLIAHSKGIISQLHQINHIALFLHYDKEYFLMLLQEGHTIYLDERLEKRYEIHLQELSNTIKLKYQHAFQFDFID